MKLKLLAFILMAVIIAGCAQHSKSSAGKYASNASVMGVKMARKVQRNYESARSVEGVENLTLLEGGITYNDSVKFIIKKNKGCNKIWMYDISHNAYLVSNGTYTWIYDKNRNTVEVTKTLVHPPDYARYIEGLLELFNVSYAGNRTFNGMRCFVLRIVPNGSTNANVYGYMYITHDYKVAGLYFNLNGTIYNIVFRNIRYNVSVNDTLFNFTPPKGAKVYRVLEQIKIRKYRTVSEAQKHVRFKILAPEYTAGYELRGVYTYSGTVLLEYTKGSGEMLIKESVMPIAGSISAEKVEIGNVTAYVWSSNGRTNVMFQMSNTTVLVSAPLNRSETLRVCRSMI